MDDSNPVCERRPLEVTADVQAALYEHYMYLRQAQAEGKRVLLAQYGMRALLAGNLASLLSATIIGILLG